MQSAKILFLAAITVYAMAHQTRLSADSSYTPDHGPYFSLAYFPKGYGSVLIPRDNGANGTDQAKPDPKNITSSAARFSCRAGYYYGIFQGDLSYDTTSYTDQMSQYAAANSGEKFKGNKSSYKLRAGKRFSNPGDTSFQFLYLGFKRTDIHADASDVSLTAYGFFAGVSAFESYGLSSDLEFVITGDLYFGNYQWYHFSSGVDFRDISKRYSVSAGGSLGIGVQYEPYNFSVLVKVSSDADIFSLNGTHGGSGRKFTCGSHGHTIGLEMIYCIPSIRYNTLPGGKQ